MSVPQPPPPFGQPQVPHPYGAPGYVMPPSPTYPYAPWERRVLAWLVDVIVSAIGLIPVVVGLVVAFHAASLTTDEVTGEAHLEQVNSVGFVIVLLGFLLSVALNIWNLVVRQGRTGRSVGKSAIGLQLIGEATGRPPGVGMTLLRQLAHGVDGVLYLGYLWPLFDDKRQTFADKIVGTVVIDTPKG